MDKEKKMRPVDIMSAFVCASEDKEFTTAIAALPDLPKDERDSVANALEASLCFRYNKKEFALAKAAGLRNPKSFQKDLQRSMALFYTVANMKGDQAQPFIKSVVKNHMALLAAEKGEVKALIRVIEDSQSKPAAAKAPRPKKGFKPGR